MSQPIQPYAQAFGYYAPAQGYWATQYVPAKTSHILHLVLFLLTFGLWAPVWLIVALYNHNRSVPRRTWVPYQYPANR